jgi:hypothetical protein
VYTLDGHAPFVQIQRVPSSRESHSLEEHMAEKIIVVVIGGAGGAPIA